MKKERRAKTGQTHFSRNGFDPKLAERPRHLLHKYASLSKHKGFELELMAWPKSHGLSFHVSWRRRQDHPGIGLQVIVGRYEFSMDLYDSRHWNHDLDQLKNTEDSHK